jgi:hypothetical protein
VLLQFPLPSQKIPNSQKSTVTACYCKREQDQNSSAPTKIHRVLSDPRLQLADIHAVAHHSRGSAPPGDAFKSSKRGFFAPLRLAAIHTPLQLHPRLVSRHFWLTSSPTTRPTRSVDIAILLFHRFAA